MFERISTYFSLLLLCGGVLAASPENLREIPSGETLWTHSGTVELNTGDKQIWQKLPKKKITFTLPEISKGKTPLLRFQAIRLTGDPKRGGHRYAPVLILNGKELGLLTDSGKARLVNRPLYLPNSWSRGYKKRMYYFETQHYTALLTPIAHDNGKAVPWEYVFDISDAVKPGTNTLELIHDGNPADGPTRISFSGLSVSAVDTAALDQVRTKAPRVLSATEKTDFLLDRVKADHPLKKIQNESDPQKRVLLTADYFKNRTPRVLTVAGVITKRGTQLSPAKKKRVDDAVQNRIASYLSGYPVEQYGDKVDYLTNRAHDRNADWIAQHNRLGLIRELAEAWRMTGNETYAKAAVRHLDHWCDVAERNFQPGTLPIWNSLNSGVRGRNLSGTIDLMLDYPGLKAESLLSWLYVLYLHGDYLQNCGRTPGNWGITEAEGLVCCGLYLPELAEADLWSRTGLQQQNRTFSSHLLPDGMDKELNWGYFYYVTILGHWDASWLVRLNNRTDLKEFMIPPEKFERLYTVIANFLHPDFRNAAWGDAWDELAINKMRLASSRFPANDFFRYITTGRKEGKAPEKLYHALPNAGFYSVRSGWDANAVHLLIKNGPDGGWHNHNDNLTFELFAYGRNLTPDTGNFTYNFLRGRAWYLQTAQHQTLTLDGRNSAFAPKHLGTEHAPDFTAIQLENQSYPNLKHRRAFAFLDGKYLLILDDAIGSAKGEVALHFQTAPGADVSLQPEALSCHTLFPEGANLLIQMLPQKGVSLTKSIGKKANNGLQTDRPAIRFAKQKDGSSSLSFVTALVPYRGTRIPEVSLKSLSDGRIEFRIDGKTYRLRHVPEKNLLKLEP